MKKNKCKLERTLIVIIYIFLASVFLILSSVLINFLPIFSQLQKNNFCSLLIFTLAYLVFLLLHELSHVFVFLFKKIRIRMFSFCGFIIFFGDKGIKVKFSPRNIAVGGSVLPQISYPLYEKNNYLNFKHAYLCSLLAGPICSLIYIPVFWSFCALFNCNIYLMEFSFFYSLFSFILNISSFLNVGNNRGDYRAYILYKQDDYEFLSQLVKNVDLMCLHDLAAQKNFLCQKLEDCLVQRAFCKEKYIYYESTAISLNIAIIRFLTSENILNEEAKSFIYFYYKNIKSFVEENTSEEFKILVIHIAYYFKYIGDERWQDIIDYSKNLFDEDIAQYYKIQIEQFCYNKNHEQYLLNNNNIKKSSEWSLYHFLDIIQEDEIKLNRTFIYLQKTD